MTEAGLKHELINGRDGWWVKIEWQKTTGYVFDAYFEPITK
jgi:hypothetical protein